MIKFHLFLLKIISWLKLGSSHIFGTLGGHYLINPAFIVAFGTEGYDSLDYKKPAAFSIPKVARVLSDYGIK